MEYRFTIYGAYYGNNTLPSLNDYIGACRRNQYAGAKMKKEMQAIISSFIKRQLRTLRITRKVFIHYDFYENNKARDKSNISALAIKFIEDALQECKVIQNDGWKEIDNFTHCFYVDSQNPRIEVTITEI